MHNMSECLIIPNSDDRGVIYEAIIPQIASVVEHERNIIANLANIAAILKGSFNFFWVGFYIAENADELVLGPFQGPLACSRIRKGKGVCGAVFASGTAIVVDDVELFPGHIACSSLSRSEVVVPIMLGDIVWGVIDVDSSLVSDFGDVDTRYLSIIASIISAKL